MRAAGGKGGKGHLRFLCGVVQQALVAAGADVTAANAQGRTPLMCAVGTAGEVQGDTPDGRDRKVRLHAPGA